MAINRRVTKAGERWQVVVDGRDPVSGKRTRHVVGTYDSKRLAQRAERNARSEIERGTFVERSTVTVSELLDMWLATKQGQVRPNTLVGYRAAIEQHVKPRLGSVQIQYLTPARVQDAINTWTATGTYRTAQVNRQVLMSACRHAIALRMLPANPVEGTTIPKNPEPKDHTIWSEAEVARVMAAAAATPLAPLWFLFLETGMRRAEALGLRWEDVDWHGSALRVSQTAVLDRRKGTAHMRLQPMGKTDAARRVLLISPSLLSHLQTWRTTHMHTTLIFENAHGNPLSPGVVQEQLDGLAERAGVRRVTIHELRHIAATRMMRANVPLVVAQVRMGHASSEMLRKIYQHADADAQREAVAAIANLGAAIPLSNAVTQGGIVDHDTVQIEDGT